MPNYKRKRDYLGIGSLASSLWSAYNSLHPNAIMDMMDEKGYEPPNQQLVRASPTTRQNPRVTFPDDNDQLVRRSAPKRRRTGTNSVSHRTSQQQSALSELIGHLEQQSSMNQARNQVRRIYRRRRRRRPAFKSRYLPPGGWYVGKKQKRLKSFYKSPRGSNFYAV